MEQDNEINNAYRKGQKPSPASPASPASSAQSTFPASKGVMPTKGSGAVTRSHGNIRQPYHRYTHDRPAGSACYRVYQFGRADPR